MPRIASTASTVRRSGQPLRGSSSRAAELTKTRRRTRRLWLSSQASNTGRPPDLQPVDQHGTGALRGFWCTRTRLRRRRSLYDQRVPLLFGIELLRRLLPLTPAGLMVQQILPEPDRIVIFCRSTSSASVCPVCGKTSARVHSHYQRHLADLPCQGRIVVLRVQVRRFRCATDGCPRRVFAERLPEVVTPRARRTARLADIQHHIALALGGEA